VDDRDRDLHHLRRRWTTDDVEGLRLRLLDQSRLVTRPHQLKARWPETNEGLLDLRGLTPGTDGLDIRYVTLERVDLSFARGAFTVFESELFECRFDSVALTRQPRFDRRFERCSFRKAKLPGLSLGSRVIDCDFTRAQARRLRSLPNTVFERCAFDAADLTGAEFADTSFVDCTFDNAQLSASTTFRRCAFVRTSIEFSLAQVSRSVRDSTPLPDQWEGEAAEVAALERYWTRYARAAASGEAESMPLEPEEQDRPPQR
jgi:uncharacterized protein YjbI with pentapeptide repeats